VPGATGALAASAASAALAAPAVVTAPEALIRSRTQGQLELSQAPWPVAGGGQA
jgi:hypothetical protein